MKKTVISFLVLVLALFSFLIGGIAYNWFSFWVSAAISTLVFLVGGAYLLAIEKIFNFIENVNQTVKSSSKITFGD